MHRTDFFAMFDICLFYMTPPPPFFFLKKKLFVKGAWTFHSQFTVSLGLVWYVQGRTYSISRGAMTSPKLEKVFILEILKM